MVSTHNIVMTIKSIGVHTYYQASVFINLGSIFSFCIAKR